MWNQVAVWSEKRQLCNRDQKTSGLEVKIIKMWNPVAVWSEHGRDANGNQKTSGVEVKSINVWNTVALWSENDGSDAIEDQKTSGLEVKQSKCETWLHYGQKTAVVQQGSEKKWFSS